MSRSFFILLSLILPLLANAASKCPVSGPKLTVQEYCDKYGAMAREQMRKHGIPASITLAQGIFESGYGSSYLAVVANNHFGIKAYRADWKGLKEYCDDDAKDEPFCHFNSVEEGFEYHSTFLLTNQRYAPLFQLSIRDYEGWANGLKACGYATNPKYGTLLIDLIEKYNLNAYDVDNPALMNYRHTVYLTSTRRGLKYIRCIAGDDLATIAREFGLSERRLRRANDLQKWDKLQEGDIIYLQSKRNRAEKGYNYYTVRGGDSLWKISQRYGVKVQSLMKRNKLVSATVHEGQVIKLR